MYLFLIKLHVCNVQIVFKQITAVEHTKTVPEFTVFKAYFLVTITVFVCSIEQFISISMISGMLEYTAGTLLHAKYSADREKTGAGSRTIRNCCKFAVFGHFSAHTPKFKLLPNLCRLPAILSPPLRHISINVEEERGG